MRREIACFVSPHGFGHATRTIALLERLQSMEPELHIQLITTVPEALFNPTISHYRYHPIVVDIGLLQKDGFISDIPGTLEALEEFIPFKTSNLSRLQQICKFSDLVLTDISILGIQIAKLCGIPSILVENFTWDWVYAHFKEAVELLEYVPFFQSLYAQADYRIQAEPVCFPLPGTMMCQPISRKVHTASSEIQSALRSHGRKIVLITTGGIATDLPFIDLLSRHKDYLFILAGQKVYKWIGKNVCALPYTTSLHHPDLINASDLVICKSGYSTIAECCQSSATVACVRRTEFPESDILEQFVSKQLAGVIYERQQFLSGEWLEDLPQLLHRRKNGPAKTGGAQQAAEFIASLL